MEMIKYSYHQIRHILAKENIRLEKIWRYKERTTHYNIIDKNGDIIAKNVTLNWIRWQFTKFGYPADYDPAPKRRKKVIRYNKELDIMYFDIENGD